MARDGKTSDERLAAVLKAQKINQVLGGAFVKPWDVQDIPDEWLDVLCAFSDELPELMQQVKAQKKVQESWRAKQGYRNYLKKS